MLYELGKTIYQKAHPLCRDLGPNQLFVEAVFEDTHVGRILVDDPAQPTAALVALKCEFFFLVGCSDNRMFNHTVRERILSDLKPAGGNLLLFPTSTAWQETLDALFVDFKRLHVARKAFTFNPTVFAARHSDWRARIPAGYVIRRYDHALAEYTDLADFWGGLDNFLAHGFGFAVLKDDQVISRCHTVMVGGGEAEIDIETVQAYRRRGLAALAACAFIEQCQEQGLRPAWSCWDNNIPSQILAQKLGFNQPVDVPALYVKLK